MNLTSSLCVILLLGAFGSVAWGKAVGLEKVVQTEADNPCVHKGKIVTIDVRRIANRFKYVQSLRIMGGVKTHIISPCHAYLTPGIFPATYV